MGGGGGDKAMLDIYGVPYNGETVTKYKKISKIKHNTTKQAYKS